MTLREFIPGFLLCVFLAGWATTAAGAPLLSIQYDITGVSFDPFDGKATGAITGGSLVINTPGTTAFSTPFNCATACGTATLVLTGASGSFSAQWHLPNLIVGLNGVQISAAATPTMIASTGMQSVNASASAFLAAVMQGSFGTIQGYVVARAPVSKFITNYVSGSNEVRTFVPEPTTAPLTGLGLLALSGYAARRRARRSSGKA